MYDLAIDLDYFSSKCLYEQIYEHIKLEIKGGKLLSGERLPSTRALAEYLQISRSTVEFAYEQLLSEGYIEARPYKGYYVCNLEELPETDVMQKLVFSKQYDLKNTDMDFIFSPNGLDMSVFPYGVWKKITRNTLNEDNTDLFSLGEPQGDVGLRQTIARYLHSARGVNCAPEQIVVGAGNDYLLLLLEKLLGKKTCMAMENATYMRAYRIFKSFGYHIEPVEADESGMLVEELQEKNADIAYVMPSHQYPTGITMPIGRRMELLKWAAEREGRYLIEDDYDSEFRYKGKPIPSLQGADKNGKVIYIGTFSKAIAPAIRVSYMVLPFNLLKRYREECFFFSSTVSRIDQRILNEFICEGYFERYLNKTRKIYREKHDILLQELRPFNEKFVIEGEHAGLHVLLRCKDRQLTEQALIERAAKESVKVYGITDTLIDPDWNLPPTIILGYGGLTKEKIIRGVQKLKQAWL